MAEDDEFFGDLTGKGGAGGLRGVQEIEADGRLGDELVHNVVPVGVLGHAETCIFGGHDGVTGQSQLHGSSELCVNITEVRGCTPGVDARSAMPPRNQGREQRAVPDAVRPQDVRRDGHERVVESRGLVDDAEHGHRRRQRVL